MRVRMYILTAVLSAIWLCQSLVEAYRAGLLFTWYNMLFALCLLCVVAHCAYSAYTLAKHSKNTKESDS